MNDNELRSILKRINGILRSLFLIIFIMLSVMIYTIFSVSDSLNFGFTSKKSAMNNPSTQLLDNLEIVNGIHKQTGLIEGDGLELVIQNCTPCHSSKLITQNHMSKERWVSTIKWMQETQNLWDLGENEAIIVNYLATYYPPKKKGRRVQLTNIEWYELE